MNKGTSPQGIIDRFSGMRMSIRWKLLFLFVTAVLPSLLFTAVAFTVIAGTLSSQIEGYQDAAVEGAHKFAEQYALNCMNSLVTLGGERSFRAAVAEQDLDLVRGALERVYTRSGDFSFLSVAVRNPDGRIGVILSYPGDKYIGLTREAEIYDFLELNFTNPRSRISDLYHFAGGREIFVTAPIRGAVIVGGIDIDGLSRKLDKIKPFEEGRFVLFDSGREAITSAEPDFSDLLSEGSGLVRFDGGKKLAYFKRNPELGWWTAFISPYRVTYRSMIYLRVMALVFIGLGLITAVYLALHFSEKVTLPVFELIRGARTLGKGEFGHRIRLSTGDELEQLAQEFNRMGERLRESYEMMEEKIDAATSDLQGAFREIEDKNTQLRRADNLKSQFLASMSHELRTPMNAIIGFTALLKDETYGKITKRQGEVLEKVIKSTRHLLNLINDILDLSKIEAGRMELIPEKIRLKLLINEVRDEIAPLAREKGLDFGVSVPEDIEIFQDYTRVRQILMNLLSNAVKFTEEGRVEVRADRDGDRVFIEVSDTGVGIKDEDLEKIFGEFVQSDGSITRKFGGTGLGLSIVRKLTGLMGGKVEVESSPGVGTLFRVFLPADGGKKEGGPDEALNS